LVPIKSLYTASNERVIHALTNILSSYRSILGASEDFYFALYKFLLIILIVIILVKLSLLTGAASI